jgi:hypothetical protein
MQIIESWCEAAEPIRMREDSPMHLKSCLGIVDANTVVIA